MSWHYSQALVAEYSQAISSVGELSAPLRSTGTDEMSFGPGRTTEHCLRFQSGMTSEHSTAFHGEVALTWYREAFPASRIPARLEAVTRRMISGRKCGESWQRQLPGTYLPRTPKDARSISRPTTLRRWVTKPAACPFLRQTWVRTIYGSDFGFVHTPTETANYTAPSMMKWPNCRAFVQAFGKNSPQIAEWLMGWPAGWTELAPLATDRFQSWLRQHGACSEQR